MNKENYLFPEIFKTGNLPDNWNKESLIAAGLEAWGCCFAGAKLPDKFGEGMALIHQKLGSATPTALLKMAAELLKEKPC
jgi:hypothetical protein